ncbi:hypothetical protein FDK12_12120 [Arthrobacter sp. NamB2]|uniref:septum formation family protein n=1 Tax=Arthrobacter sp. NamB2 TaxID=2576035 RepID=UPI0010C994FA|nr:septum formation family protein [Arthrobacter sp. NamB2]TKV27439.1 hypothetical protein FDK12_12120 [Arthrobacter sp. NamB2]
MAQDGVSMRAGEFRGSVPSGVGRAVLSIVTLALVTGCTLIPEPGADRDAEGAVTAEAETDAFSIEVGDCISDPGVSSVTDIIVLPCDELHDFEAFAATEMPDGDYPGAPAAITAASEFCAREFTGYVGVEYDASVLEMLYFYPVEESWNTANDREILCFVAEPGETPVTGSLRNARR